MICQWSHHDDTEWIGGYKLQAVNYKDNVIKDLLRKLGLSQTVIKHIGIVSDKDFRYFTRYHTEIITRNRLENQAEIVTVLRGEQNVMLNFFDENLVAEDNSLRLNLSPVTNIMTQNGQRFTCSPRNMELLVYYTNTTFSIPPMTTPQKVIVMCEM